MPADAAASPHYDFFISYTAADKAWAEWIAWELKDFGFTVDIQAWNFRPGQDFIWHMQNALQHSDRTIAILSPDYLKSDLGGAEWRAVFNLDPTGEQALLLPVYVRAYDAKQMALLSSRIYINLVGLSEAEARAILRSGINPNPVPPTSAPAFPGATPASAALKGPAPRFPGTLSRIWNITRPRNPNFTGREAMLDDLSAALGSGRPAALPQAISGLGGVGKTQLALEYAYRHATEYDVVWWLRAEEAPTLAADYAALAGPLALPEAGQSDQSVIVDAVRRWLEHNGGWLLIFDNACEPNDVKGYLPVRGQGHVLITSRHTAWRGVARGVDVTVFTPDEATAFLLWRSGRDADTSNAAEKQAAADLAETLGYLPLALEQAAAYMDEVRIGPAAYGRVYTAHAQELLARRSETADYPDSVATTWELAFQRVEAANPAAAALLNLCAFLAPDDIPRSLFITAAQELPEPLASAAADEFILNEAIVALRAYSLIIATDNSLGVHRLVQAVTAHRMDDGARRTWKSAAVAAVNNSFPDDSDDVRNWPTCAQLLPHALVVAMHEEDNTAPETLARLLNQVGLYMGGRADFASARSCYERALRIDEAVYGPDHPDVATMANNLGMVLQDLGDLAGAKACYERALAIDEAVYGPDRPDVATTASNLGRVLQDLGDLARAKACYERALRIDEAVYGPDHPTVARDVNNLGGVLHALGDLAGAKARFERALVIDEAVYGPDHPNVARDVNNLGGMLQDLDDLVGAKVRYERALAIMTKFLGKDHPNTAIVRGNLTSVIAQMEANEKPE
jgi:tetratricopeptide (TPR) repeat protein